MSKLLQNLKSNLQSFQISHFFTFSRTNLIKLTKNEEIRSTSIYHGVFPSTSVHCQALSRRNQKRREERALLALWPAFARGRRRNLKRYFLKLEPIRLILLLSKLRDSEQRVISSVFKTLTESTRNFWLP